MLCSSCGLKVPNNARYCKNCGAEVNASRKGTFQEGALTSIISNNLPSASAAQTAAAAPAAPPKRSERSGRQTLPSRRSIPSSEPAPAPSANQRAPGQTSANGGQEEPQPAAHQKKYRSSASAAPTAGDLVLADGEVAIRTYFCSEWTAPWYRVPRDDFKGYLTVTNRRIIYRSHGENVRSVREIPVESYRGFECGYGYGWNALEILAGMIVSFAGIGLLFFSSLAAPVTVFVAGLILILMAHRRTMVMRIYSEQQNVSPISLVRLSDSSFLKNDDVCDAGVPAEQTAAMMSEFGALLSDIMEMGDDAAAKWAG